MVVIEQADLLNTFGCYEQEERVYNALLTAVSELRGKNSEQPLTARLLPYMQKAAVRCVKMHGGELSDCLWTAERIVDRLIDKPKLWAKIEEAVR